MPRCMSSENLTIVCLINDALEHFYTNIVRPELEASHEVSSHILMAINCLSEVEKWMREEGVTGNVNWGAYRNAFNLVKQVVKNQEGFEE